MIAFVGEAPASSEEKQGRCFVGPSGSMMWDVLGPEADIVREQCWVTNAQLCRIEKVRLSTGAVLPKDTVQEMASRCCRLRLIHELQTVNPRVIMPLGETALQSVIGVPGAKIYPYRGSIQEVNLQALAQKAYEELNEQA
jgi:DNA polymerase